jgi:hypothetical protein
MSKEPTQQWVDEALRQVDNCGYTSATFTIWLRALRCIQTFCIVSPIVFGALATWKILAEAPLWAAVFTLLATVIPPAYRAWKIDEKIEDYVVLTGEFTNLRDRFRQVANITSHRPFSELDAEARKLMERLEKARSRALTPPEWCFWFAQRKYKAGHYSHDYDVQKNSKRAIN